MEKTFSACYETRQSQWLKMRKLVEGAGSEKDLILQLPGMEQARFLDYKARAYYLNAVSRTIEAFSGLPLAKPVKVEEIDGFEHLTKHATRDGRGIDGLARKAISETLTVGRIGILVDYPQISDALTVAQAEANHIHAFSRIYQTESILDFDLVTIGAKQFLSRVLLSEFEKVDGEDIEQLRELTLTDVGASVSIYRADDDGEWSLIGPPVTLMRSNEPLRFIPFRFINPTDGRPHCVKPPMLDVGTVSESHLNNSALLEWGLMWTANPTPVFVGLREDDGQVGLGSSDGIVLEEGGNAFFMEFSGQGLGAISQRMEAKQRDMAVLGARLLSDDKKGVEAAETTRIRKSGEQSSLASVCGSVSEGITQVLQWMVWWDGGESENVSVRLNTDFLSGQIGFAELKDGLELLQSGQITQATFFSLLVKAELVAPNVTAEDYQEELDNEAVPMLEPINLNAA